MGVSIIVAAAENDVIGRDNRLIWRLSNDMRHFKELTMGHTLIMGRKTFESIGKALPGRRNIVVSRNRDYRAEGCLVVHSPEDAVKAAGNDDAVFVIGGAELYRQFWAMADTLYLTRVHARMEGDARIPAVDQTEWEKVSAVSYLPDEKNEYAHSIITYKRKSHH